MVLSVLRKKYSKNAITITFYNMYLSAAGVMDIARLTCQHWDGIGLLATSANRMYTRHSSDEHAHAIIAFIIIKIHTTIGAAVGIATVAWHANIHDSNNNNEQVDWILARTQTTSPKRQEFNSGASLRSQMNAPRGPSVLIRIHFLMAAAKLGIMSRTSIRCIIFIGLVTQRRHQWVGRSWI